MFHATCCEATLNIALKRLYYITICSKFNWNGTVQQCWTYLPLLHAVAKATSHFCWVISILFMNARLSDSRRGWTFRFRSKKQYVINWLLICYRALICRCAGCESRCLFSSSSWAKFISRSLVCHTIQDTSNLWLPGAPCNWRERFSFIQSCNFENLPLIDDGRAWLCECVERDMGTFKQIKHHKV